MGIPTLVYDGDCAACTRLAQRAARLRPDAQVIPWQSADLVALGVTEEQCRAAVQWCAPGHTPLAGAPAVAACLTGARQPWRTGGRTLTLPGVRWLADRVYAVVARHRHLLPGATAACALPSEIPGDSAAARGDEQGIGPGERSGAEEPTVG